MKILHLAGLIPPYGYGAAFSISSLICGLKRWHDIDGIVVGKYSNAPQAREELEAAGITLIDEYPAGLRHSPRQFLRALTRAARIAGEQEIDLIHTHAHMFAARLLAIRSGKPYVITMRDAINRSRGETAPGRSRNPIKDRFQAWAFRSCYRASAGCVAISEYVQRDLTERMGNHPHLQGVIYNGIDTEAFVPGEDEADPRFAPLRRGDSLLAGIVGRIDPLKRPEDIVPLVRVCREAKIEITFVFFGKSTGEDDLTATIRQMLAAEGSEEYVKFFGPVDDMPRTYRQLDLLVHLSLNEPFGRVFPEAMACELPVLGAAGSAIHEIVVDSETGFICPSGEWNTWAERLNALTDPSLRERMGKAGRVRVLECFSLKAMCRAYADFYRQALDRKLEIA